ncbi:hypothetical protein QQ045_012626 [Rhodiola kirilowii]
MKDKRDISEEEDEIECDEANDKEIEQQKADLNMEETREVPETQMTNSQQQEETDANNVEASGEFVPFVSRSAQKRARKKEKRNKKSDESNCTGETGESTSTNHKKKEGSIKQKKSYETKKIQTKGWESGSKKQFV